jgi:ribonuclease HII
MYQAVMELQKQIPEMDLVLIDGNVIPPQLKKTSFQVNAVIGGDALCYCIGAASIIAKVTRDRMMKQFDVIYPGFEFSKHKGYPSPAHKESIKKWGPTPIHRRTFKGVVG